MSEVIESPIYQAISDGIMDPPVAPTAPTGLALAHVGRLRSDGVFGPGISVSATHTATVGGRGIEVNMTTREVSPGVPDWTYQQTQHIPLSDTATFFDNVESGLPAYARAKTLATFGTDSAYTATVTSTTANDTTAPATPTSLALLAGPEGYTATWAANTEKDLAGYEIATSATFAGVYTSQGLTTSTIKWINAPSGTAVWVKVRAFDKTGNFSAYCVALSITPAVVQKVTNSTAKVTIDSTGLTVEDGNFILKDQFGSTIMVASGFAGSWLSFLFSGGFYNDDYTAGDTVDIAVTEVGSGATIANYAASITTHLPYWVVAASGGTLKRVTDATFPSSSAIESSSTGGAQTNRWYQDVAIGGLNNGYGLNFDDRIVQLAAGGNVIRNVYASARDETHALVGSRTWIESKTFNASDFENAVTGVASTDLFTAGIAHGLSAGNIIQFDILFGGAGITLNQDYYVIASGLTATDFRVSATLGGATIDFTTNVTAGSKYQRFGSTGWDFLNLASVPNANYLRIEYEVIHSAANQKYRFGRSTLTPSLTIPYINVLQTLTATDVYAGISHMDQIMLRSTGIFSYPGSTLFPTSGVVTGDKFFRSDIMGGMWFFWDGTRWVSEQVWTDLVPLTTTPTTVPLAATSGAYSFGIPSALDLWMIDSYCEFIVAAGGTALGAAHKWVGTIAEGNSGTNRGTINIDSGLSNSYRAITTAVGAVVPSAQMQLNVTWTKTGTPGTLAPNLRIRYRLIAT